MPEDNNEQNSKTSSDQYREQAQQAFANADMDG